ncbi:hemicentin-1-like isoform X2 [Acropora palmata]|uniref:hemicentin-1-like isoform X2 n=1 Tax=Acropora palmata TaxID=6131 RepID=UPI003D9FC185
MITKGNDTRNPITHYYGVGITYHPEKSKQSRLEKVIEYAIRRRTEMVAEKSGPSFASILTILSIVMYTGGFLRLELEFNKQKDKINQLESVVESMKTSKVNTILRNRRSDYSTNKTENKHTPDDRFTFDKLVKLDKLVAGLKKKLCQPNIGTCSQGPPGPPGPPGPRGERGERGRRGNKGRSGNKGDSGIMGRPGKSGKQGIMGPPGSKGETGLKGEKGDTGTAGMKGAKGEPGESIAAPTVAVSPAKMTVNESKTASFQCSVSGNPKPVSTWSKLEGKSEKILSATTDGKLILTNAAGSDSGVYKCSASNILGQQAQALVRLVVNAQPRISLNPGPRYAIEGNTFTLPTCHVTGYPTPVVTWRKLSSQLPQGRVRYNHNALQISQVRKEDSDTYTCSAKNVLGKAEKNTLFVVVSLPQFTSKPPSKIVSMLNSTVRLNCSATGDPQPIISWRKQGGQLPVGRSQQINGTLVITNLQQSDAGSYICTAASASVFILETVTSLQIMTQKAALSSSSILGSLDIKYLVKLNSFLAPVLRSSSRSRFVRCWRAKTDGWAASTFHSNCDGKGPTVTIIQVGSYIFGGYTDVSWSSPSHTILRNRRSDYSMNNKTENKHTPDESLSPRNYFSGLKLILCQPNTDRCYTGPPGLPGPPGPRGVRGARGRKGYKGDNGIMGPPGRSGKQGIMGPPGSKGETGLKGEEGDTGTAGMKGAKGEPGESIAAPTVAVSPAKMTVNESKTASFQCSVSGNPKPVSTWIKLEGKSEKILSATRDGKLILPNAAGSDSGVYKCSASNILGQAQALVRLIVNVQPGISLNPGPSYAIQGNTFTLPICHVTGYPTPVVTWRKLSSQLPQGRVWYNNSALQISQVRKEDSDTYTCSAKNLLGKAEKNTMLGVVSLPRFTSKPPSKIVLLLNSTERLNCSATGDPQPIISWRKQGGQLSVGRSRQINGALVITNLQQSDAGNYICTATSAGVFDVEAVTTLEIQRAALISSSILGSLNIKYIDKLNSFLAPVLRSSSRSRFVRCWRAKTGGWAASTFHRNCDGMGPTVTIIQVGSYIFGGYTDISWSSSCVYASSSKSFIYSLYNINGFSPVKLKIKSGRQSHAIYRCSSHGPTFGGGNDIRIYNNAASNRNSYTYCGYTYHPPPGYSSPHFSCRFYAGGGSNYFTPTDVEVFYETTT